MAVSRSTCRRATKPAPSTPTRTSPEVWVMPVTFPCRAAANRWRNADRPRHGEVPGAVWCSVTSRRPFGSGHAEVGPVARERPHRAQVARGVEPPEAGAAQAELEVEHRPEGGAVGDEVGLGVTQPLGATGVGLAGELAEDQLLVVRLGELQGGVRDELEALPLAGAGAAVVPVVRVAAHVRDVGVARVPLRGVVARTRRGGERPRGHLPGVL